MEGKKKSASVAGPECANCTAEKERTEKPYLKCSRCHLVTYCSSDCQKQHWTSGGHHKWCLTPAERSVKSVYTSTETGDSAACCPVCLEPLTSARITLPCSHGFHTSCLEGLRENAQQQTCPICRAVLPSRSNLIGDPAAAQCANCGADKCSNGAPLVHCSKCRVTLYCGRDCQKVHWKNGGHKSACAQKKTNAAAAADGEAVGAEDRRIITLYSNGFTVGDGPFRALSDPENAAFVEAMNKGVVPEELQAGGTDVNVSVVDKMKEEYTAPPPPAYVAYSGGGASLG